MIFYIDFLLYYVSNNLKTITLKIFNLILSRLVVHKSQFYINMVNLNAKFYLGYKQLIELN